MPEPLIHIEHLSRSFGTLQAIDDLSMDVPSGIVFGFLGPNGAGKTTTIHLLLGLLEPTRGAARVMGFDTRSQPHEIRTRCGALAVNAAIGLSGKLARSELSCRYSGRNSWPHSEIQWASSMAKNASGTWRSHGTVSCRASRSGEM